MSIWLRRSATLEEEAQADREYWQQYSPGERLAQMDDLRSDWAGMNGQHPPNRDHAEFVACLNRKSVRVLVVGAHALAVHAKPRYTKDLDLFVEPSVENARRILATKVVFSGGTS